MIYIPSKGRAGRAKTIAALAEENILAYTIVVEPQDFETYKELYPKSHVISLPANNKGISYARNFIMEHAMDSGFEYIWVLDDDLNGVGKVANKKTIKQKYHEVLPKAQEQLAQFENLVVGALEYQQYAWAAKKDLAFNSYCDTCVCLYMKNARRFKYREQLKEDRDMVLQALSSGFISARTQGFWFSNPKNGSNVGGLHDEYKAGKEKLWSEKMIKLWPGVCVPHPNKTDRSDVKINWKAFKSVLPRLKTPSVGT